MKRTFFLVFVFLWLLGGCGSTPEPELQASPQPTQPPTATPGPTDTPLPAPTPEPDWQEFISEDGGFAVLMPAEPVEETQPASLAGSAEHHMVMARYGASAAFGVAYTELPEDVASVEPQAIQDILDLGRDGALASIGGTLVTEQTISLEGFDGRHIEFTLPEDRFPGGGTGVLRVYLVGSRAYQVLALGASGQLDGEDVARFLESFRLLDLPATPAADLGGPEAVLQAVFDAAKSGDFAALGGLCDPLGENDGDTQAICDLASDESDRESFVSTFQSARMAGPPQIGADGNTADIPFLFGPDGDQEETMVLILRDGRWYLLQF